MFIGQLNRIQKNILITYLYYFVSYLKDTKRAFITFML